MSIKDINKIPKFRKKLKELQKRKIQIGILGDQQLALVGGVNEFGAKIPISDVMRKVFAANGFPIKKETKNFIIPERSWLRSSFDDKKNIKEVVKNAERFFIVDEPLKKVLDTIGLFMVAAVQKKIRSNIQPGNHPFTTQQKGGKNKTLVNTGRLIQGVTHKIV
jgi:hypothetical protein